MNASDENHVVVMDFLGHVWLTAPRFRGVRPPCGALQADFSSDFCDHVAIVVEPFAWLVEGEDRSGLVCQGQEGQIKLGCHPAQDQQSAVLIGQVNPIPIHGNAHSVADGIVSVDLLWLGKIRQVDYTQTGLPVSDVGVTTVISDIVNGLRDCDARQELHLGELGKVGKF